MFNYIIAVVASMLTFGISKYFENRKTRNLTKAHQAEMREQFDRVFVGTWKAGLDAGRTQAYQNTTSYQEWLAERNLV